jgi:uncharacterized protein YndB with AHSA1/START domain
MSDTQPAPDATLTITQPSDIETVVERRFNATPDAIFTLWTTPELVRQWWSNTGEMTVCDIDLRVGGAWRWALHNAEHNTEIAYSGTYLAVEHPSTLAFTELFEMMPGSEYTNEITLAEADGATLVTSRMTYSSQEWRDGHFAAGFEPGIRGAYARIDALLDSLGNE